MRTIKGIMHWLTMAAVIAAAASCDVDEDESDCIVDARLVFHFTRDGQEYFGTDVPSLSVFVFDEKKVFAGRWDENDNTKFDTGYTMSLPLMPGNYSFVVWGGLKDDNYYLTTTGSSHGEVSLPVAGQTQMSDMVLRLRFDIRNSYSSQRNYVDYIPGDLYFGIAPDVTLANKSENTVTVDLAKNSKQIGLTVIGLPDAGTRANIYPHMDISMESPNGGYNFWNDLEGDGTLFTYVLHDIDSPEPNTQTSTIHTLSMQYGNGHELTLYNTGTGREFYKADLLEDYIRKVPAYTTQEAVDAEDRFDITLDVRSPLGVEVTVNGWNVGVSGSIIQ